ncbi:MAG: hypothetical protein QOH57_4413 [Mycobacterium sp.]|nr:hypothetical protein [Mycobacterium sp.]
MITGRALAHHPLAGVSQSSSQLAPQVIGDAPPKHPPPPWDAPVSSFAHWFNKQLIAMQERLHHLARRSVLGLPRCPMDFAILQELLAPGSSSRSM